MPESKAKLKEKREVRKKAGLCTTCGKNPPDEHGSMCATCRAYYQTYRKKRTDKGLCPCGRVPATGWKRCERCLARQRRYTAALRDEVFAAYGGYKCVCCGETQKEFLQLDHVDNDGAEHRRKIGRTSIYGWLKKHGFPEGFQVLCANCNYAKGFYGYCPHQGDSHREVNGVQRTGRRPLVDCLP